MKKTNSSTPPMRTSDAIRAATSELGTLRKKLSFLIPLTDTERKHHRAARIGVKALRTLANRLTAAREYHDHVPAVFDMRNFEEDATSTIALGEMLKVIDELRLVVHDTFMAVGQRACVRSASIYGYIQVGSITAKRLERTVDWLATRSVQPAEEELAAPDPVRQAQGVRQTQNGALQALGNVVVPAAPALPPEASFLPARTAASSGAR
jgi:hypothetical protein